MTPCFALNYNFVCNPYNLVPKPTSFCSGSFLYPKEVFWVRHLCGGFEFRGRVAVIWIIYCCRCTYNSSMTDHDTHIGPSGGDEMCNLYIMFFTEPDKVRKFILDLILYRCHPVGTNFRQATLGRDWHGFVPGSDHVFLLYLVVSNVGRSEM